MLSGVGQTSSSRRRTTKQCACGPPRRGTLIHDLKLHAHRVNSLALGTDFVLRTGFFEPTKDIPESEAAKRALARERFEKAATVGGKIRERLVSGSDRLHHGSYSPEPGVQWLVESRQAYPSRTGLVALLSLDAVQILVAS